MTVSRDQPKLKRTSLHAMHCRSGGRMVPFGGWHMPVQYSGIVSEHMAVRSGVGLFDVSHMGEVEIRGPEAVDLIDAVCSNRAASLKDGQAQYSGLLNPQGGFVDDLLVHRLAADHYMLCVNAANQEADFAWFRENNTFDAEVRFASDDYAQLAIQGPKALDVASELAENDLSKVRYYWFVRCRFAGEPALVARTGYTGEDGFEVYVSPSAAEQVWTAILEAGKPHGILPCGLGARNTLRLEAAMSLYGHEIDASTTPYEAGLGWIVKLQKPEFCGRDVLARQKRAGVRRKIAGFEMTGRGIARDGYRVLVDGSAAGRVTSASPAPALRRNIGLCMLPLEHSQPGQEIEVEIRGRAVPARIVRTPFYKRSRT
ncbi:MAG: glycine cleavage system aminomethyltransferase GcvT [Bryobacterales bacterium]|nr:glycine cleavage system aminomethyltransferase GcvT [Bryobacterales bacterium]